MADIHPTAIVDPGAEIAASVVIEPYSIIENHVTIDHGAWIGPHTIIRAHTTIGRDTRIFQFCSIGEAPQHLRYAGEPTRVTIGERNTIREYCTINRGTEADLGETRVGNDNFIMSYAHIAHDCVLGDHIIFANGSTLAGHVDIGDYAIMGGFTLVHQYCKIGQHCITGGGCVCLQDVPPYIVVAGNPARPFGINNKGLRRRNFSDETVRKLNKAYRLVYRRNLDLKTALAELDHLNGDDPDLLSFADFLHQSRRGIVR